MIDWPANDWPTICPFCGQKHDATTNAQGHDVLPDNGDVSLCFGCGAFCVFDEAAYGGMRKPTKKEQRSFDRDERLKKVRDGWRTVKRQ